MERGNSPNTMSKAKQSTKRTSKPAKAAVATEKPAGPKPLSGVTPEALKRFGVHHRSGKPIGKRLMVVHAMHEILQKGPVTVEQLAAKIAAVGFSGADGIITSQLEKEMNLVANDPYVQRLKFNGKKQIVYVDNAKLPSWKTANSDCTQRKFISADKS